MPKVQIAQKSTTLDRSVECGPRTSVSLAGVSPVWLEGVPRISHQPIVPEFVLEGQDLTNSRSLG